MKSLSDDDLNDLFGNLMLVWEGQITCSLPYGDDFLKEVRDQVQVLSNARQASFVESVRQSRFWLLSLQEIFSDGNAYGLDAARWNSEAFITWVAECMSYVI